MLPLFDVEVALTLQQEADMATEVADKQTAAEDRQRPLTEETTATPQESAAGLRQSTGLSPGPQQSSQAGGPKPASSSSSCSSSDSSDSDDDSAKTSVGAESSEGKSDCLSDCSEDYDVFELEQEKNATWITFEDQDELIAQVIREHLRPRPLVPLDPQCSEKVFAGMD